MSDGSSTEDGPMTLRAAAERTSRSITTLRRYIRSGRLHAEKRYGRFGPEYFVTAPDLVAAGFNIGSTPESKPALVSRSTLNERVPAAPRSVATDAVPITLYQELQLKHEQLLVQYGMVRAGGLRTMELEAENEDRKRRIAALEEELAAIREFRGEQDGRLRSELTSARLELEGRALEISALHEKVRTLEMLTRNSETNDSIEAKYRDVVERTRKVRRLSAATEWPDSASPLPAPRPRPDEPEH